MNLKEQVQRWRDYAQEQGFFINGKDMESLKGAYLKAKENIAGTFNPGDVSTGVVVGYFSGRRRGIESVNESNMPRGTRSE